MSASTLLNSSIDYITISKSPITLSTQSMTASPSVWTEVATAQPESPGH